MGKYIITLLLGVLFLGTLLAQEPKTRKEKRRERKAMEFEAMDSLIASGAFTFTATKANPPRFSQIDLTTHTAFLTVKGDSVASQLPFFGRVYNVDYSGSNAGITFESRYSEYRVVKNMKKLQIMISFQAKNEYDSYDCFFSVNAGGSATLSVTSNSRAPISYYGNLASLKKD